MMATADFTDGRGYGRGCGRDGLNHGGSRGNAWTNQKALTRLPSRFYWWQWRRTYLVVKDRCAILGASPLFWALVLLGETWGGITMRGCTPGRQPNGHAKTRTRGGVAMCRDKLRTRIRAAAAALGGSTRSDEVIPMCRDKLRARRWARGKESRLAAATAFPK